MAEFQASQGPGLTVNVKGGTAFLRFTPTTVPDTSFTLAANATSYIYLDTLAGSIQVGTTPFYLSQMPIAIVVTNATQVTTLNDYSASPRQMNGQ